MVRMKLSKDEFDPKALDVKVEPSKFKRYRGEIPRNGTILIFRVTRMWWTQAKDGTSQIYLLAIAEQNKGSLNQYNGLPIREYLTFKPDAAFRYMNFLNTFGLTTRDIYNKMDVEPEPDSIGDIINSIAGWEVGSDDALCRVAVIRDRYDPDELKAKADRDGWMPLDEDESDDEDEDDEDEDEQPARPARGRRSTSRSAGTRAKPASRRRAEPEPEEDEDEDEDIDDEDEDIDDEAEDQEDDEDDEAEEEDDEEGEDEAEEEPPARPARRAGNRSRASSSSRTRPASARRGSSGTSSRADGERTGTRRSTARTERTPGPRGSKSRDGGSREDPPF